MILIYAAVLYMNNTLYAILNKSENPTLQYFIFCEKVLDEKYLLKITCVALLYKQTVLSLETSSEINFEFIKFVKNMENASL